MVCMNPTSRILRLRHSLPLIPVPYFGMVLGLGGLGNGWRVAARVWGAPHFHRRGFGLGCRCSLVCVVRALCPQVGAFAPGSDL